MKSQKFFRSDLAPVRGALAAWRKTRQPRQPIPERLWGQAALLAQRHGVSAVARVLRLDYYALKRRADSSSPSPGFVEMKLPLPGGGSPGCVAELQDAQGRKLVFRWSGIPGPELLGLVQAFWKQGA